MIHKPRLNYEKVMRNLLQTESFCCFHGKQLNYVQGPYSSRVKINISDLVDKIKNVEYSRKLISRILQRVLLANISAVTPLNNINRILLGIQIHPPMLPENSSSYLKCMSQFQNRINILQIVFLLSSINRRALLFLIMSRFIHSSFDLLLLLTCTLLIKCHGWLFCSNHFVRVA